LIGAKPICPAFDGSTDQKTMFCRLIINSADVRLLTPLDDHEQNRKRKDPTGRPGACSSID
jgi:hypothetical protein